MATFAHLISKRPQTEWPVKIEVEDLPWPLR